MTELQVEKLVAPEMPIVVRSRVRDPRQPLDVRWARPLLLAVFCLLFFFYGINTGDLWRTENLRALIAAEFLRSGDWIVPRLYGEPYLTKPPGMYAAIALASWPMGEVRTWSARLPSALAATITVLLFYWYFARVLGRSGGLAAALVLPLSLIWLDKAGVAEIDMLQVAWVTGAILCFLRALEEEEASTPGEEEPASRNRTPAFFAVYPSPSLAVCPSPRPGFWWAAAMLCVAGGVMTKWTAPAFFYCTVIPLLWWRGRLRLLWTRQHLLGAGLAAGLVIAWAGAVIADVGWQSFSYTVGREAVARFYPEKYGNPYRWELVLVHPLRLLATALPWSAVALLSLRPGFMQLWDERGRRLLQALHCWVWPNMIFWSFVSEHAPRHSFPLFPGIAGLAAFVWAAWSSGRLRWPLPRVAPQTVLAIALAAWFMVKLVHVHAVTPARNEPRQPRAKGERLASLVPAGKTLHVLGLMNKDEGILFYYRRPVRRLPDPSCHPLPVETLYCLLEEYEWQAWHASRPLELVARLAGESGDPLLLAKVPGQ